MYQVLFHLDESDEYRFNLVLNNITNLQAEIRDVEIKLVANAQGIKLLEKDSPMRICFENSRIRE